MSNANILQSNELGFVFGIDLHSKKGYLQICYSKDYLGYTYSKYELCIKFDDKFMPPYSSKKVSLEDARVIVEILNQFIKDNDNE